MANEWLLTDEEIASTSGEWSIVNALISRQHAKTLRLLESKGLLKHSTYTLRDETGVEQIHTPHTCPTCAVLKEVGA